MHRVAAVVLAAGASTRLGQPKQLLVYKGESLVKRAVNAAITAGASPVIIVLGAHADAVGRALDGMDGVMLVTNERWRQGLASSLVAGISAAASIVPERDGVLITVADQPLVDGVALRRLLHVFDEDHRLVAAEYSGTIGVPAVVGREHFDALSSLHGDAGAGSWLRTRLSNVTRIPIPDAAIDIDTAADVQQNL